MDSQDWNKMTKQQKNDWIFGRSALDDAEWNKDQRREMDTRIDKMLIRALLVSCGCLSVIAISAIALLFI